MPQGHDRSGGIGDAARGADNHDSVLPVVNMVQTQWEFDLPVESPPFHPALKLTGDVSRIFADLKHGHHDHFDRQRSLGGGKCRADYSSENCDRKDESVP